MSSLRVELACEFRGGPAILFAMDGDMVAALRSALADAATAPGRRSILRDEGRTLSIVLGEGPTAIELHGESTVWHVSMARLGEIAEKLDALCSASHPGHHYVDIAEPVDTLVLSKDEYPDPGARDVVARPAVDFEK
jgi:hypothetical protein